MHFEKWQALGNDYVIVEERELPFELTPGRVSAICAAHTGIGSDGVLLIRETDEPEFVAELTQSVYQTKTVGQGIRARSYVKEMYPGCEFRQERESRREVHRP